MTKTISTLCSDIRRILKDGSERWELSSAEVGERVAEVLRRRLRPDDEERAVRVWFSNVGSPCNRKLWYKLHRGSEAQPFGANTLLKFTYGDLIEELILELARLAGHSVEYEQHRLEWEGITGRIDAVIDGVLVDVKSSSGFGFTKFKYGGLKKDDSFGYLGQLGGYLLAARDAGLPVERNKAAFLAVNKDSGEICLDTHKYTEEELDSLAAELKKSKSVAESRYEPPRGFDDEPEGASGNRKLCVNCNYCEFNHICWPNHRVFLYAGGRKVVRLSHVASTPRVLEVPMIRPEEDT
jgi:hypothetical protein